MATKLNSDVIRESSELVDEREIMIALRADQNISLKLKGMKSGTVTIGIKELWDMLADAEPVKKVLNKVSKDEPMISLHRLRSLHNVTPCKPDMQVRMDELLVDLIENFKTGL